ncbi:MAG: hypothetical protein JRC69_01370 [Deltaproteobacteria bacterium]|nr:hypothetical protein [Deltaproteobacteria bacterium]
MIRVSAMVLLLLFPAVTPVSFAQDQRDGGENVNGPVVQEKKEQATAPQQAKPTVWPQPFQPSVEVGADSEVSFPTDI